MKPFAARNSRMSVESTVREYYRTLRAGDPLVPFFAERDSLVKFGVSERLAGYEQVANGLREQTQTTRDWTVESRGLVTDSHGAVGWFADDVRLAWTDESGRRVAFDTRWSGTLKREGDDWRFVGMHVSAPHEL